MEACEKIIDGTVRAMVLLGGNLVRAVPEHLRGGAGMAQAAAHRADPDQTQPQRT